MVAALIDGEASSGIKSFIENGVRSAKGKHKMALFQPLNLLDLDLFLKDKGLCRISEAKSAYPFKETPYNIYKSSIALFLAEVLCKVLKEEEENVPLFDFLEEKIKELTKATIRCIPLDAKVETGTCVYSGKPSDKRVIFARAY